MFIRRKTKNNESDGIPVIRVRASAAETKQKHSDLICLSLVITLVVWGTLSLADIFGFKKKKDENRKIYANEKKCENALKTHRKRRAKGGRAKL